MTASYLHWQHNMIEQGSAVHGEARTYGMQTGHAWCELNLVRRVFDVSRGRLRLHSPTSKRASCTVQQLSQFTRATVKAS
jgi:hypothetical protein